MFQAIFHIFKLFFVVLKELVFDSKEEYDYKHAKFNARKVMLFILIFLSFIMNIWLFQRFVVVAVELTRCRTNVMLYCETVQDNISLCTASPEPKDGKKPNPKGSDSKDSPKETKDVRPKH